METFTVDKDNLSVVVDCILSKTGISKIILLNGDLGSGKTTLAKQLIKALGVKDAVTSPTFNIVSEYRSENNGLIYHFDLYRIKQTEELYEIGFEEYLESGHICIIEWPEIAEPFLTSSVYTNVKIEWKDEQRIYEISMNS